MSKKTETTFMVESGTVDAQTSDAIYQFMRMIGPQLGCNPAELTIAATVALARLVHELSVPGRRKTAMVGVTELLLSYLKPGSPLMEGEPVEKTN